LAHAYYTTTTVTTLTALLTLLLHSVKKETPHVEVDEFGCWNWDRIEFMVGLELNTV